MKLYDTIINDLFSTLHHSKVKRYDYQEDKAWPESDGFELLLQKDTAYELGAGGKEAVNFTCVTDDPKLLRKFYKQSGKYNNGKTDQKAYRAEKQDTVEGQKDYLPEKQDTVVELKACPAEYEKKRYRDQILLFGKDLPSIKSANDYARITLILIKKDEELETDSEKLFQTLQDLDFVKYNLHPKGYMVRTSNQNYREQVRIGIQQLKKGMTFEAIGDSFIRKYRQNERVLQVCVIFITDENMDYQALYKEARQTADIRNSLSRIKKGLPTECSICEIREICDEVEGLRELHFGKQERKKSGVKI